MVSGTIKIGKAEIKVDDRGLDKDQKALLFIIINREAADMSIPTSLEDFEKNIQRRKFRAGEIDLLAKAYDRSLECAQRLTEIKGKEKTIGQIRGDQPTKKLGASLDTPLLKKGVEIVTGQD